MLDTSKTSDPDMLKIEPGYPLRGVAYVPGDKSLSHRTALFGAMAEGKSYIENFLISGVTQAMLDGLAELDVAWRLEGNSLMVHGIGLSPKTDLEPIVIDCGNSGTTMRLLAGALAAWNIPAVLDGSPGLRRRPMGRIINPLKQMGVRIEANKDRAPLTIKPIEGSLNAINYDMPVASAQVKSCLLLAGMSASGDTVLREPGPSRDHTERLLSSMGVEVERRYYEEKQVYETRLYPPASGRLTPLNLKLPGDISAAAFIIVAALITPGSEINMPRVGINPTRSGLLEALEMMGADLQIDNAQIQGGEPFADLTVRHSRLNGVRISGELVVRMIDEFPIFAVAAAYAEGETVVEEAIELRYKESDRIRVLCSQLASLGIDISEKEDGFILRGGTGVQGGEVDPHGDHRLAMALAVAGLNSRDSMVVKNAEIIHESFPEFAQLLRDLGGHVE